MVPLRPSFRAPLTSSLVASALFVAAAPARAEPTRVVNVLELVADFDDTTTAQAVTNQLRLRISDGGDFLLASDNTSFGVTALAVRCDQQGLRARPLPPDADSSIDARCLRSVGAHLSSKAFFWGHVYHEVGGQVSVKLHLWTDLGGDRSKTLTIESGGRERLVSRLYEHLVHPESAADVRLSGVSVDESGELFVDGKTAGEYAAGDEVTVRAGEHQFELRREGKPLARVKATVVTGKLNEVRLEKIGASPPPKGPLPITTVIVEPRRDTWKRPVGFVGLGLGAALIGAGVLSSLRVRAIKDDFDTDQSIIAYRSNLNDDACDVAAAGTPSTQVLAASANRVDRLCSGASTLQVAQIVFYGAGALAAGAGAYLLATAPRKGHLPASTVGRAPATNTVSFEPWGGPKSTGFRLGVSFLAKRMLTMTSSRKASYAALSVLLATGLFAFSPACFVSADDTRGLTCAEARERGRICNPGEGVAGTGGLGGMGGSAGGQFNGMGGTAGTAGTAGEGGTAGVGGMGGGGSSGAGPCPNDDACVSERGAGSLCISDVCTKATGECDSKALVVVALGRTVDDATLANACHFRSLDAARALFADTTARLALYADSASSTLSLAFTSVVLLDGHHSDPNQPVALDLPKAGTTLVALPAGGTVRGVGLTGDATSKGIVAGAGALSLSGPLRIEGAAVGLELGDNANATGTTTVGPIAFVGNAIGVQVAANASVTLRGDAQPGSLLLEGNGASTGLLVLDGGSSKAVFLEKAQVTKHAVGVEIQRGRAVTVNGCTFVQDRQALTLNAEDATAADVFLNVQLASNDFTQSRPAPGQGVSICGARLGVNNTTLRVGQGNTFPSGNTCNALVELDSCDTGGDLGFNIAGKSLQVQCL